MAIQEYVVEYSTDGSTWNALDDVQEISARIGRVGLQDGFEPSSATFTMRYPDGYYTPNSALIVDTQVRFYRAGGTYIMWYGRIRNVVVTWGKPYAANVGASDYVSIECEGALAQWGRLQGNDQTIEQDLVYWQISDAMTYTGLTIGQSFAEATSPTVATSQVTGSWSEWLNTLMASVGGTIKDGSGQLGLYTREFVGSLPVSFSDTTNDSTHQVYDNITFDSLSQNYYTQVQVDTNTVGTITVSSGSAPYRTLRLSTFNVDVAQATALAEYYLGVYGNTAFGITELSAMAEAQNTFALDLGYAWWDILGYRTYVTFRGTQYYATILGSTFTATPDGSRFTYSLINANLTPYFILDDTTFGVLDTSKLAW